VVPPSRPYHHGNLPRALLDAAIEVIAEVGPSAMSFREVARRAGVSSAAPVHHFGDKAGLFTALATEGYRLLAGELAEAYRARGDFLEVGVAYVHFAVTHRAHFEVMFRPDLFRSEAPELHEAKRAAAEVLYGPAAAAGGGSDPRAREPGIAAWSLVHGLATLLLNGNLPPHETADPEATARRVASHLFRGRPPRST
jgi:AcrR family transcriptional regulator